MRPWMSYVRKTLFRTRGSPFWFWTPVWKSRQGWVPFNRESGELHCARKLIFRSCVISLRTIPIFDHKLTKLGSAVQRNVKFHFYTHISKIAEYYYRVVYYFECILRLGTITTKEEQWTKYSALPTVVTCLQFTLRLAYISPCRGGVLAADVRLNSRSYDVTRCSPSWWARPAGCQSVSPLLTTHSVNLCVRFCHCRPMLFAGVYLTDWLGDYLTMFISFLTSRYLFITLVTLVFYTLVCLVKGYRIFAS